MTTSDPSDCRRKIAEESHKAIRKIQTTFSGIPDRKWVMHTWPTSSPLLNQLQT